ncbi:hypothetical protein V6N13_061971 [Hibiscus sabdariffa]
MLMVVSSSIVSRCILSHKSEEDGCSKFGELVRRVMIPITGFCVGDMFPYLRKEGMLPAGEAAEKVDMTELYGLTVSMKTPLHALAIPRSSF